MGWTFFFLMVILKIPIVALLYIVWWAIHAEPDAVPPAGGGDGGAKNRERHPRPPRPRRPRRGPHAEPEPAPPRRVRTTVARSRQVDA